MANFPVSGKPIPDFDLLKVTHREWKSLFDPKQPQNEADEILSRASGLSPAEIGDLNFYDFRALFDAFLEKARKPLENDTKN